MTTTSARSDRDGNADEPPDLRGVRDAVLDSAGTLAVAGAGTAASWAGTLGPVDAVLDLRALTGVITHNPGDMTVSVRAGTPLRELNAELAGHGQHVALRRGPGRRRRDGRRPARPPATPARARWCTARCATS